MTSTSRTISVDQPVEKVAAFLSDFSTTEQWDPHTVSCKRLDPGPLAVGSQFENVQHLAGRDSTLIYTVTEYQPGRRIVLQGSNEKDSVSSRDEMTFAPTGNGGTEVTYSIEIGLHGPAKLATPAMPLALKRLADEGAQSMIETLQRL